VKQFSTPLNGYISANTVLTIACHSYIWSIDGVWKAQSS